MRNHRGLAIALVAALLFVQPLALFADEARDGEIPSNGLPRLGPQSMGWDGTAHRAMKTDATGILRTTEEYPFQLQTDVFTSADTARVTTAIKQFGNGWTNAAFGKSTLTIYYRQAGPVAKPIKIFLYGSDDNVNFYPVLKSTSFQTYESGDTTGIDTLTFIPPLVGGASSLRTYKVPLPSDVYLGKYGVCFAAKQDSIAGVHFVVGIVREGRWF